MSISGRTALLAKPNLHRTGPGGGKNRQKEEPKLFLSLSPSLSLPPRAGTILHSLLFESLGWHALMLPGWILLLSSK